MNEPVSMYITQVMGDTNLLDSFQSSLYPGTIAATSLTPELTWIRGHRSGIACKTAGIKTLRVFVGFRSSYAEYDGMAIDSLDLPRLQDALTAMDDRRDAKETKVRLSKGLVDEQLTALQHKVEDSCDARRLLVQVAKSNAGLTILDPQLARRIKHFETGDMQVSVFRELFMGPKKATKALIRSPFRRIVCQQ